MDVKLADNFIDTFDTIFLLSDGTLLADEENVPRWRKMIKCLKGRSKRILYYFRDDTSSRKDISRRLNELSIDVEIEDIVCPTFLLANYLKKRVVDKRTYVLGSSGLVEELHAAGIRYFGAGPETLKKSLQAFLESFKAEERDVGAVVVGFDEHISYVKMSRVASYLIDPDVLFLATSSKQSAKPFVCFAECCTERKAKILENDEAAFGETIREVYEIDPERTLLIADRHERDARLGQRCGFKILLISDSHQFRENDVRVYESDIKEWQASTNWTKLAPDFYYATLTDVLAVL